MSSKVPTSAFLRLPRELRYGIYDHLCCPEPKCYPFLQPPISSIDQRAPPTELILACRYLHEEIQTYFYRKVTFRLVARGISNPRRRDMNQASLVAIRRAKKIDLRLYWNVTPMLAKLHVSKWPHDMNGWLAEQINLLLDEAKSLEMIIVSVSDASEDVDWSVKKGMLGPLRKMVGRVNFRVGEVTAMDAEEDELTRMLAAHMKELNKAALTTPGS